jgi:hypothetical protein
VLKGDVPFDDDAHGIYAQDAWNYFQAPLGVVVPRSRGCSWPGPTLRPGWSHNPSSWPQRSHETSYQRWKFF